MSFLVNGRSLAIVFVIVLLVAIMPVRVVGQEAPPTGILWVTWVNATPTTTNTGTTLDIVFRVVHFTCDPYLGSVANPADGIKTATFLLVSVETQQSHEYTDTPVTPTGNPGEYRADIQMTSDDPTGKVWAYVKGNSLNLGVQGGVLLGPPGNTSSEQTTDPTDNSLIQNGPPTPPTPPPTPSLLTTLLQGNGLLLILLAAIILLLIAISLLARRRGKP